MLLYKQFIIFLSGSTRKATSNHFKVDYETHHMDGMAIFVYTLHVCLYKTR